MKFAKRLLMVGGAVALAGIIGTMMVPKVAHAVVSTLVTVVNTPNVNIANTPVPVSGNVNATINGTPSVNVSGMPAVNVASVSGNVPVANPLDGSGNPIPLVTQNLLGGNAFLVQAQCFLAGTSLCGTTILSVPANEVAVVESLSGSCTIDTGTAISILNVVSSGTSANLTVLPGSPVPDNSINAIQSFGQNIKGYFFGGASGKSITAAVSVDATQNATHVSNACTFNLAGYFVR